MRVRNWFYSGGRRKNFGIAFGHLKGKPARYLEIGVFQGASIEWMANNILTHPDSMAIGLDPWLAECMGKPWTDAEMIENKTAALAAVARFKDKVRLIQIKSEDWFAKQQLPEGTFDAIYLDGMHDYDPLKADFESAWPLLKVGGTLVMDDYRARKSEIPKLIEDLTPEYGPSWEVLFVNYQIGLRKVQ